jgi:hypothetical protein
LKDEEGNMAGFVFLNPMIRRKERSVGKTQNHLLRAFTPSEEQELYRVAHATNERLDAVFALLLGILPKLIENRVRADPPAIEVFQVCLLHSLAFCMPSDKLVNVFDLLRGTPSVPVARMVEAFTPVTRIAAGQAIPC